MDQEFALSVARRLQLGAQAFGIRSKRRARIKNLSSVVELLSATVALSSNLPILKSLLGTHVADYVEASSLIILIFVIIVDRVFSRDPPERLQDYDLYMRILSSKITGLLSGKTSKNKEAELEAIIDIGNMHLADIESKWPEISNRVEKGMAKHEVALIATERTNSP